MPGCWIQNDFHHVHLYIRFLFAWNWWSQWPQICGSHVVFEWNPPGFFLQNQGVSHQGLEIHDAQLMAVISAAEAWYGPRMSQAVGSQQFIHDLSMIWLQMHLHMCICMCTNICACNSVYIYIYTYWFAIYIYILYYIIFIYIYYIFIYIYMCICYTVSLCVCGCKNIYIRTMFRTCAWTCVCPPPSTMEGAKDGSVATTGDLMPSGCCVLFGVGRLFIHNTWRHGINKISPLVWKLRWWHGYDENILVDEKLWTMMRVTVAVKAVAPLGCAHQAPGFLFCMPASYCWHDVILFWCSTLTYFNVCWRARACICRWKVSRSYSYNTWLYICDFCYPKSSALIHLG